MPDETAGPAAPRDPAVEPRQRWRLVVARGGTAPELAQRESATAWEAAVVEAGLPLAWTSSSPPRPRLSFGAPLPVGMAAESELVDLVLVERWPAWRLREALAPVVPPGWRLVSAHDVWLGGPPLAGRVAAADYRIELDLGDATDGARVSSACSLFLAARRVPRRRRKGEGTAEYDLRPLVVDVAVAELGPPVILRARTRFHPERGTGRPEEVVGAIGDLIGTTLTTQSVVRERLLLVEDLV